MTDDIARRYVTVLEDQVTPSRLFVSTMAIAKIDAPEDLFNDLSITRYPNEALRDMVFSLFAPPYNVEVVERWRYFPAGEQAYTLARSFATRCLEQPIAIEQSPVTGKSLQDLAKHKGAVVGAATTVGLVAFGAHTVLPILLVGGSIIVISASLSAADVMTAWIARKAEERRHKRP